MDKFVTILVPAYNEESRIGDVLKVICKYPRARQVIVIDDGSDDNTAKEASQFPVKILKHRKNKGKGAALQTGIDYVKQSPLWMFLDADLINLQEHHLDSLIIPFEEDSSLGMTIGMLQGGGKKNVDLAQRFFGILNGQRCLSNAFVSSLPSLKWSNFGVEIFLSKIAQARKVPVKKPVLKNLTHYTKEEKYGFAIGFPYRLQMYRECLYALFNWQKHYNNPCLG